MITLHDGIEDSCGPYMIPPVQII